MTEPAETLIAFDYGEKHIGVAVGQTLTSTANALETIRVTRSSPDWDAISRIVETWNPDALVVGLPLNMDGSEQTVTRRALPWRAKWTLHDDGREEAGEE